MNPPRLQTLSERRVDLANLNNAFQALASGELVEVQAPLRKQVIAGKILLSFAGPDRAERLPFEVWQSEAAKIKIAPGVWYANGTAVTYAGAELTVSNGTDQYLLATLTVEGTVGVAVALASALPSWSTTTRWRVLAMVTASSGTIKSLTPKRAPGDLYLDDVFPRGTVDYRVAIWDTTATGSGWSGKTLVGGKGPVNDVVRATESDVP